MLWTFMWKSWYEHCSCVANFCPALWDPMNCSPQAPLSTGFSRQEYWSELPFPSPGDLPDPGTEPATPALAGEFFTTESSGKPIWKKKKNYLFAVLGLRGSTWDLVPWPGKSQDTGLFKSNLENMFLHTLVHSCLFAMTKWWKKPRCPLMDERVNKL